MFNQALKEGIVEMVLENKTQNDETIICRWHVNTIFDELEESHQYICIVNDITDSLNKGRELMRINKALDQSQSIIVMTDRLGTIEYVNNKFVEVTQYDANEVVGEHTRVLRSGEQPLSFYKKLWMTITSGKPWEGEFHNKKKDGTMYWCRANIYPLVDGDEITGYVGVQVDTTSEKMLLETNSKLKTKLFEQDKVASLGMLSSGIIHEINNPLSYVQGNIKYIIDQLNDLKNLNDEEIDDLKDAFLDIDKGVSQIKDISEGLKKYIFKAEMDEKNVVNLIDEINTVLIISKNEYKYSSSVELLFKEQTTYEVFGYASKLKQVFMNLVINASHAISSMERDSLGKILIELKDLQREVWIIFKDNGSGMTEKTIQKIYEPFYTTKSEGIGSGLGLSVSRQIIEEDHGGIILCESVLNEGTTFTIKLPKGTV